MEPHLRSYYKVTKKESLEISKEDDEFDDWGDEGDNDDENIGLPKTKLI